MISRSYNQLITINCGLTDINCNTIQFDFFFSSFVFKVILERVACMNIRV